MFGFNLLIWHFFVLTQKSTQKKSRQKDASSRTPSHPRLFVGPAHLSFKINILFGIWFLLKGYCFLLLIWCILSCTPMSGLALANGEVSVGVVWGQENRF
jgi:hypothetical protein